MELARFANLEPGGMDSGKIIDKMERLLAARVTAKADLRQKARDKEIEVAGEAVDALNQTAETFYGIEESQAEITGQFRGKDTSKQRALTAEENLKLTEMYGGAPPTIFTQDEFRAAFNAVEGDDAYRPEFDRDHDGVIDFGDFKYMTEQATALPNGSWAFGETMTLESKKLSQQDQQWAKEFGLDEDKFIEAKHQFKVGMARDMDKFLSSEIGRIATFETDDDGNFTGNITYMDDPLTGEPLSALERSKYETDKDQFEETFNNHLYEFGKTMDLEWAKLKNQKDYYKTLKVQGNAGLIAEMVNGYYKWKEMQGNPQ